MATANAKKQYYVMEFIGTGDSFFGGSANDRILTTDGVFLDEHRIDIDGYKLITHCPDDAAERAQLAKNKRPGSTVSVLHE